jgi:hypothetical protein
MRSLRLLAVLLVGSVSSLAVAGNEQERPHHGIGDWFSATMNDYGSAMNHLSGYKAPPYIPIGVSLGARHGHFMFGTEVSLVFDINKWAWAGGYLDGLYGAGQFCFSLGPELGISALGLDGGYMGCTADAPFVSRFVGRVFLTTGVLGVYARVGTHDYWDAGALLKIPWGWSVSGIPMR